MRTNSTQQWHKNISSVKVNSLRKAIEMDLQSHENDKASLRQAAAMYEKIT